MKSFFFLFIFSVSLTAQAKRFSHAYIGSELPGHWNCKVEGTEWVCGNPYGESTQVIIALTVKESDPVDTFQTYQSHLTTLRFMLLWEQVDWHEWRMVFLWPELG